MLAASELTKDTESHVQEIFREVRVGVNSYDSESYLYNNNNTGIRKGPKGSKQSSLSEFFNEISARFAWTCGRALT